MPIRAAGTATSFDEQKRWAELLHTEAFLMYILFPLFHLYYFYIFYYLKFVEEEAENFTF